MKLVDFFPNLNDRRQFLNIILTHFSSQFKDIKNVANNTTIFICDIANITHNFLEFKGYINNFDDSTSIYDYKNMYYEFLSLATIWSLMALTIVELYDNNIRFYYVIKYEFYMNYVIKLDSTSYEMQFLNHLNDKIFYSHPDIMNILSHYTCINNAIINTSQMRDLDDVLVHIIYTNIKLANNNKNNIYILSNDKYREYLAVCTTPDFFKRCDVELFTTMFENIKNNILNSNIDNINCISEHLKYLSLTENKHNNFMFTFDLNDTRSIINNIISIENIMQNRFNYIKFMNGE